MDRSADLLAELRDLRLPALSEASVLADAAAAFAVGLTLALLVALALRLFARRPPSRRERALAELAASRGLPREERLLAQARLLQRVAEEQAGTDVKGGKHEAETGREHWAAVLDRRLGGAFFASAEAGGGAGPALREGLYRPGAEVDPERIDRELALLLRRVRG